MILYLPFCLIAAYWGTMFIGFRSNDLQYWYAASHPEIGLSPDIRYEIRQFEGNRAEVRYITPDGEEHISSFNMGDFTIHWITYWIISYAQGILIPAWIIFCFAVTAILFYNRELKKPISILLDASRKIAENQLDFTVEYTKQNELGMLCAAFEDMRSALYENNLEMWRQVEERKRLNAAFSHDLRTPLTVLRGYTDFLEKYIPDGRVTQEKLLSVIAMMNGQILRLEHYTQKMNDVQKLEDIVPNVREVSEEKLFEGLLETGEMTCGDHFRLNGTPDEKNILIDMELIMQVYENMISNAMRYAETSVVAEYDKSENILTISVLDDGEGFSEELLKNATHPFFRGEKEPNKTNFGLGLYICRILCEKCGGTFTVENHENGGKVTATFFCG